MLIGKYFSTLRRSFLPSSGSSCADCNLIPEYNHFSFVRISGLNWVGRVNRMGSKRKGRQVFNNNRQGEDDQNTDGGIVYRHVLINAKLNTGKRGQAT